jgi:hypothetical protein
MMQIAFLSALIISLFLGIFFVQTNDQPVITLERTLCKGSCPAYKLSIYRDGTVIFEGSGYVLFEDDTVRTRIPYDTISNLLKEAERIGYLEFKDEYSSGVIDLSPYITKVTIDGKIKKVTEYGGAPKSLVSFENHIDQVTHSTRWIGVGEDRTVNEFTFGPLAKNFPDYNRLNLRKQQLDSEYNANSYETNTKNNMDSLYSAYVADWERSYTPVRDSIIRVRKVYYRSLTDRQVDSLWQTQNK